MSAVEFFPRRRDRAAVVTTALLQIVETAPADELHTAIEDYVRDEFADERHRALADHAFPEWE
jgi:hypothetical protein